MKNKFEPGDTVKIVRPSADFGPASHTDNMDKHIGKVYTVERCFYHQDNHLQNRYLYYDLSGVESCWSEESLELVEEENNMENFTPFYVEVDGPQHSRMLQEIAFEEDVDWGSYSENYIRHEDEDILVFKDYIKTGRPEIAYNSKGGGAITVDNQLQDFTIEEFRQALRGKYKFEEPIEINEYEVEFYSDHIEVGCKKFNQEDLEIAVDMAEMATESDTCYEISGVEFSVSSTLTINGKEVDPDTIIEIYNRFNN